MKNNSSLFSLVDFNYSVIYEQICMEYGNSRLNILEHRPDIYLK